MSTRDDVTADHGWFTGEDQTFSFAITDTNTTVMTDITGWDIEWKLSDELAGEPITLISAVVTDGPNGICEVDVPSAATINLTPGTYFYDLRRIDPGSFSVLAYGEVVLQDPYVDEDPW